MFLLDYLFQIIVFDINCEHSCSKYKPTHFMNAFYEICLEIRVISTRSILSLWLFLFTKKYLKHVRNFQNRWHGKFESYLTTKKEKLWFSWFCLKKEVIAFRSENQIIMNSSANLSRWGKLKTYYKAWLPHGVSNFKSELFPFHYHFAEYQICCDYVF